MLSFFYFIQFVVTVALIMLVIFQKSDGGTGLISSNHYNSMFTSKALSENPLTKFTIILGIIFFVNSIIIGAMNLRSKGVVSEDLLEKIEQATTSEDQVAEDTLEIPLSQ